MDYLYCTLLFIYLKVICFIILIRAHLQQVHSDVIYLNFQKFCILKLT